MAISDSCEPRYFKYSDLSHILDDTLLKNLKLDETLIKGK